MFVALLVYSFLQWLQAASMFRPDAPEFFVLPDNLVAWVKLQDAIKSSIPAAQDMQVFGSTVTGLGLAGAAVDVTVIVPGKPAGEILRLLANELPRLGFELRKEIYDARGPISLRLRGLQTTDFHLSVNNALPMYNTRLIKAYLDLDPCTVDFVMEVKRWANLSGRSTDLRQALFAEYAAQVRQKFTLATCGGSSDMYT